MPEIVNNLLNLKEVPGDYFFEMILLCALAAIILIPVGLKLSQKLLSEKSKTFKVAGGKQ